MIKQETAREIFACNVEIENSIKMLESVKKNMESNNGELSYPSGWDGTSKTYCELGVPTGAGSFRIYRLNGEQAIKAIQSHIHDMNERLKVLNLQAKEELG